jgi:hypothetical protein
MTKLEVLKKLVEAETPKEIKKAIELSDKEKEREDMQNWLELHGAYQDNNGNWIL